MKTRPCATQRAINCGLQFITKANVKHNNFYTYNNSIYTKAINLVLITCPLHGDFKLTPNKHLNGRGCQECSKISKSDLHKIPFKDVISKANKIHNNQYTYLDIEHIGRRTWLTIECKEHGVFRQRKSNHLEGRGCRTCAENGATGFKYSIPATLYFLSVNDGEAFKIGITNNSVEERYDKSELDRIKVLWTKEYDVGRDAADEELRILRSNREFKYSGEPLLKSGNTELLSINISEIGGT